MKLIHFIPILCIIQSCGVEPINGYMVQGPSPIPETPPYTLIDSLAKNVSIWNAEELEPLADVLADIGKTDEGKLRALFIWITHHIQYDAALFDQQMYTNPSAEEVLRTKMSVCTGFSALAMDLAARMDLRMEAIQGYSKGLDYTPENPFTNNGHVWNAALVDGNWELVDFTWGQGYSDNSCGKTTSYCRFDEQWFCPKPSQFAPTHFPKNEAWQLLKEPILPDEYVELPAVYPEFFQENPGSDSILKLMLNSNAPIADFFPQYDCEVLQAPLFNQLVKDSTYHFRIKSDSAEKIEIHDLRGDKWTKLDNAGNLYQIDYKVRSRKMLGICVTYPGEKLYLLQYNTRKKRW